MKRIPIKAAKQYANDYKQDQVAIVSLDKIDNLIHIVTYGKTKEDCQQAAKLGEILRDALGLSNKDKE